MRHVSEVDPNANIKLPQETQGRHSTEKNACVWLFLQGILGDGLDPCKSIVTITADNWKTRGFQNVVIIFISRCAGSVLRFFK